MANEGWSAVAAAAIGAVIGPATLIFMKRWYKPIIKATVEPKEGSLVETPLRTLEDINAAHDANPTKIVMAILPTGRMKFARLKVRNSGRRDPAIKCRGILVKIEKIESGGVWTDLNYHEAGSLDWSNAGQERDLPKDVPVYLDVCKADCKTGEMKLCVVPDLFMYNDIINDSGSYRFHILLTAENADHITKIVRVNWNKATLKLDIELVS